MRLDKVIQELRKMGLKGFITDHPPHLFYLTDIFPSAGRLLVIDKEMVLFLDGRYGEEAKKIAPCEIVITSDLDKALIDRLPKKGKIGFSEDKSPYGRVKKWLECGLSIAPSPDPIAKVRQIKEPSEIILMREAAKFALEGASYIEKQLKVGVTEKEMATAIELFWLSKGHHPSFSPIIGFGERTAYPHYKPKAEVWDGEKGVQIDIGVEVEAYQSDVSRYLLFEENGQLSEIYHKVLEAQQVAILALRPGVPLRELDRMARDVIEKGGYKDCFPHSLGHSIGLEVHESPIIRSSLPLEVVAESGMCLTIEPGIYLPGRFGVRLEETVLVTPHGAEVLTR